MRRGPVPDVIAIGKESIMIEGMAAAQNEISVIGIIYLFLYNVRV